MSALQAALGGAAAKATGWALLHVLWQATVIAVLLAIALYLLRGRSANARYVTACIALAMTFALPVATGIASFEATPEATPFVLAQQSAADVPLPGDATALETQAFQSSLMDRVMNLPVDPVLPWIVGAWLIGVALLSMRIAVGLTSVSRMCRLGTSPVAPSVERMMRELADGMGLRRFVRILRSRRIEVPTVIGSIRPIILLPASALSGLSPEQLETILAHELAHIRRHDFAVNLVQTAVETLLFFHPAVWWISRQVRVEREHCCDDIAVALCGDPVDYARALATMEELRADLLPLVAATGGSLSSRIRRLLGIRGDESEAVRPAIAVAAALAVTMAAVLPLFAGAYVYDVVLEATPGERIVVIGDNDDDLDYAVDAAIEAELAAAAGEDFALIKEEQLAHIEQMRAEIERATEFALGLKEEDLEKLERARAEMEAARFGEIARIASASAQVSLEAEEIAALFDSYSFSIAPVAPVPPTPPTPLIATAVPAPPAPPIPPIAPMLADAFVDFPVIVDISTGDRGTSRRSRDEKPLDPDNPTVDDLIFLKSYNIDGEYIREMQEAGLKDLSARELAILSSYNVSASTVREMRSLFGDDLSTARIASMASLGIDAAWVREMRETGIEVTASDAIRMKSLGIDAAGIKSMEGLLNQAISSHDAVRLRSVGVDADYATDLASVGLENLTASELVRLKSVGVGPEYVKTIRSSGLTNLTVNDYIRLRSVGVDADYVGQMKASGLSDLDSNDLVRLKSLGINGKYASSIRGAGYPDVTANDLTRLKSMGIDAEYINAMNGSRGEKLSIRDLFRLKSAGIDASYLNEWSERK